MNSEQRFPQPQQPSELTPRQRAFFEYLCNRAVNGQSTPSLRQAAEDLGVSHTAVANKLREYRIPKPGESVSGLTPPVDSAAE